MILVGQSISVLICIYQLGILTHTNSITERMRITDGNILIGGITNESVIGITPKVQVEGLGYADSGSLLLSLFNNSNDTNGAY